MMRKPKSLKPRIFFNASVILAGLKSPQGGSAKVMRWAQAGKIQGVISEIVFDEVMRRCPKVNWQPKAAGKKIVPLFNIISSPPRALVEQYANLVIDVGDSHVLASARETNCQYLVSLDKKHLLSLKKKVRRFAIVSPGELIEGLSQ